MAEALVGSWNYDSAENMEAYMDAQGIPDEMRELARTSKPKVEISKNGNVWTIKTTAGDKVSETNYPVGEEIETMTLVGKTVKALLKETANGLIETQKSDGSETTFERAVEDGHFIYKMSAKGVQAKVKFVKG
ncbi:fatty acid-binding protein, heart [Aplysia californica]|uniref:Fatty acid-binding protein, heart n=1 Tax=Aplysia californica TaxID=6500 RepID=A0ABM0JSS9_APLCA|nr:fatty acid-binding protein, heart [Aplysia californica]